MDSARKSSRHSIKLTVNGMEYRIEAEARKLLVDVLRHDLGLTGTHVGCEQGVCGNCTVILNGRAVNSCLIFAVQADGSEIETVEGLASGDELHPLQKAFQEHHALQCGFCTPGVLMNAVDILRKNPEPNAEEIREDISGNMCRCGEYENIIEAIKAASIEMSKNDAS
ncbi:MAG: (2Fe-2S)-binding protein [Thermodesulfobacteriota bacterium]|nr:(2Fe-2S)-binding protein [Thermodesulfobacteriota bacterium]